MAESADETPVLQQVIAELNSGYGDSQAGPLKEINELTLKGISCNGGCNTITGHILIGSYRQGMHGDSWNEVKPFDITLDEACFLAQEAPCFRPVFNKIAGQLSTQLREARGSYEREILNWADAGLPTLEQTPVMKPLRLAKRDR